MYCHPCPCISLLPDINPGLRNSATTTTRNTRKRGRRGGVRNRVRHRKNRPFIPSVIFGNCRSLYSKIDELRVNCRFLHQYRESCCIGITESWLHANIPDSAMEIPQFTMIRSDRTEACCKEKRRRCHALPQ